MVTGVMKMLEIYRQHVKKLAQLNDVLSTAYDWLELTMASYLVFMSILIVKCSG